MPVELPPFRSDCPLIRILDIFGDKWTLLILRDVITYKKNTYKELIKMPEHISTNILAERLDKLVQLGLLSKSKSRHNKLIFHYLPTKIALELLPMVKQMHIWSENNLFHANETPIRLPERMRKLVQSA